VVIYANKQKDFVAELKFYVQKAQEDAKQHLRKALTPLDPLGHLTDYDPAEDYPQLLPMGTLKGYFGEVFAGLIAEYCSPFGENTWKVPAFLFRFHYTAFHYLELWRQTQSKKKSVTGRHGDDCLAFQLDSNGQIKRSLCCEAKCTADHDSHLVSKAYHQISRDGLASIKEVIEVLQDSSEPDAPQWIDALQQLWLNIRLGTLPPDYERCDLISYVCRRPGPRENWARLPTDKPHPQYTGARRLEAVEVHLPDIEGLIHEVYGITSTRENPDQGKSISEDNAGDL